MDNYVLARDRAQAYFLQFDQEKIINRWDLQLDDRYLYVEFLGRAYSICRKSGEILRLFDGKQAGFSEVLSIFDLLCHTGKDRFLTGCFAPVNSLRGCPVAAGVDTPFYDKTASYFDRNKEAFKTACIALGGERVAMGDIGFRFPIFSELQAILKFYESLQIKSQAPIET